MLDEAQLLEQLSQTDKLWHLEQAELMQGLSAENLKTISGLSQDLLFPESDQIFDQGQEADTVYFLNRGSVRLAVKNFDGREKTIGILSGGELFGLEAIAFEENYQVQAVAHEESWVSALSQKQFVGLARSHPDLSLNFMRILIRRLGAAHEDIRALCFMDIQQRLVQTLLKLSQTHGRKLAGQQNMVKLTVRISHDYLARLIASNRPYLSNIMSNFKKKGLIRYQRNKLLVDTEALRQLVNGHQLFPSA